MLLSLYCRQAGRITAIAKGARRSKRRFVNKLEIFSYLSIDFTIKPTRSIAFLHEAELYTSFPTLRTYYPAYLAASVVQELLLAGIKEGESDQQLFRLSLWALHNLQQKEEGKQIITFFFLRYLDLLGYRPELGSCQECRQAPSAGKRYILHPHNGALLCSKCKPQQTSLSLEPGTVKILHAAQDIPLERLGRLKPSTADTFAALHTLHLCCHTILQREIHSWRDFLSCS